MTLKWWHVVLIILYVINLAILDFFVFSQKTPPPVINNIIEPKIVPTSIITPTSTITPTLTPTPTSIPQKPRSKIRNVSYLPISTSGSTMSNSWANLSGTDFYFDIADYPGLVEIYFETNIHLFNGNGIAFVRLYDVTHSVWVTGSESTTNQQKDTAIISSKVLFASGKNLIRVQAKSLTADTAIFTSGRLKIVTEN